MRTDLGTSYEVRSHPIARKPIATLPKRSPARREAIVKRFELAQDRLVLQASDLSLETLASMVETDVIDLRPVYAANDGGRPSNRLSLSRFS
jgi:hypothetical protein